MNRKLPEIITVDIVRELRFFTEPNYVLRVARKGRKERRYTLTGTAGELVKGWWYDRVLFGVVLDRLQECPEEAVEQHKRGRTDDVLGAIDWLRAHKQHWLEGGEVSVENLGTWIDRKKG
jgi:hypothetical protein